MTPIPAQRIVQAGRGTRLGTAFPEIGELDATQK